MNDVRTTAVSAQGIANLCYAFLWLFSLVVLLPPLGITAMLVAVVTAALVHSAVHWLGAHALDPQSILLIWLLLAADVATFGHWPSFTIVASYVLAGLVVGLSIGLAFEVLPRFIAAFAAFVVYLGFYLIALLFIVHAATFGTPATAETIHAILQTDLLEATDYLLQFIPIGFIVSSFLVATAIATGLYAQPRTRFTSAVRYMVAGLIAVCVGTSQIASFRPRALTRVTHSVGEYVAELREHRALRAERKRQLGLFPASKSGTSELYVIVIGESLSRDHMSLYGYARATTPHLDELERLNQLIRLDGAFSTHTHTVPVLTTALTAADQFDPGAYLRSPSIVDIAQSAGFDVHWITNQQIYGAWDNGVSILAKTSDNVVSLNRGLGTSTLTSHHDDAVLPEVAKLVEVPRGRNRVVVVHLSGSHSPYCARFPQDFKVFDGPLPTSVYGALSKTLSPQKVNCYDNSVRFNDWIVDEIIELLARRSGVSGLVYFADHGEDVLLGRGHGSHLFTYRMSRVPLVAWFSVAYRAQYVDRISSLESNRRQLFPTDYLYDTVLGLMGVTTEHYDSTRDLSRTDYLVHDSLAFTLHGRVPYVTADNIDLIQERNIASLSDKGWLSKVLPHRVNTAGKLRAVLGYGLAGFESDVYFQSEEQGHFDVGHDSLSMAHIGLEEHLDVTYTDQATIWLDIKNVDGTRVPDIVNALQHVRESAGSEHRFIVESSTKSASWAQVAAAGFHTSYYLTLPEYQEMTSSNLDMLADAIGRTVRSGGYGAVSFDSRHYDFVKRHLERRLDGTISYHLWDLTLSLGNEHFIGLLEERPYLSDTRVQTVLVVFQSPYHL